MALIGTKSKSFLRNSNYIEYVELYYDKDGENILDNKTLETLLQRDSSGDLIINKKKILATCIESGISHRMIFNTMNLRYKGNEEIKDILKECQNFLDENGVSGIIEFHPADQTLNSDHVHLWINTDSRDFANSFGGFLVSSGYSNKQDVFVREFEKNDIIGIDNYSRMSNTTQDERKQDLNSLSSNSDTLELFNDLKSKIDEYNNHKEREHVKYYSVSKFNQTENQRGKRETEIFNSIVSNRRDDGRGLQKVIANLSKINDLSSMSNRGMDSISRQYSMLVRTDESFFVRHKLQRESGEPNSNMRPEREWHQDARTRSNGGTIMDFNNLEKIIDGINNKKDEDKRAWDELFAKLDGNDSFDKNIDNITTSSASQNTKNIAMDVQRQRKLLRM